LREALPPVIHVKAGAPQAAPLLRFWPCCGEAGGGAPGEAVIIDRLADILLVQAIRAHLALATPETASWLAGIADPRIGRALRGFHANIARTGPWRPCVGAACPARRSPSASRAGRHRRSIT